MEDGLVDLSLFEGPLQHDTRFAPHEQPAHAASSTSRTVHWQADPPAATSPAVHRRLPEREAGETNKPLPPLPRAPFLHVGFDPRKPTNYSGRCILNRVKSLLALEEHHPASRPTELQRLVPQHRPSTEISAYGETTLHLQRSVTPAPTSAPPAQASAPRVVPPSPTLRDAQSTPRPSGSLVWLDEQQTWLILPQAQDSELEYYRRRFGQNYAPPTFANPAGRAPRRYEAYSRSSASSRDARASATSSSYSSSSSSSYPPIAASFNPSVKSSPYPSAATSVPSSASTPFYPSATTSSYSSATASSNSAAATAPRPRPRPSQPESPQFFILAEPAQRDPPRQKVPNRKPVDPRQRERSVDASPVRTLGRAAPSPRQIRKEQAEDDERLSPLFQQAINGMSLYEYDDPTQPPSFHSIGNWRSDLRRSENARDQLQSLPRITVGLGHGEPVRSRHRYRDSVVSVLSAIYETPSSALPGWDDENMRRSVSARN